MVVADLVRIFDDSSGASEQGLPTLEGSEAGHSIDADGGEEDRPTLPAGAEVGRYKVLECIGFGGMGVVYSAYDPKLDRRVALKVLRTGPGGAEEVRRNARLLREAKAMAKLSHPNVIVVHDVGSYEERVFLAMEFVDGTTMTRWMRAHKRTWNEIREVFIAAGRGLAAAHEAGLVHRDFKPDNVLIGDDGRVRVTDFGLARFRDESIEQSLHPERLVTEPGPGFEVGLSSTLATLTKTGVLVGTPAYMAPEQYEGGTVTAATDQFSFCVALYEALYGQRPFEGRSLAELATNVCQGKQRPLGDADVPARLRDAVLRGLAVDRTKRFANMHTLLTVLNRRPTRTLRRWAMVGVPSLIAAGSLWWDATPAEAGAPLCRKDARIDGLWGAPQRSQLIASLLVTETPLAGPGSERAVEALDDYAQRWAEARETICNAEDPGVLHGSAVLQGHCLMRARSRLSAVLEVVGSADSKGVSSALQAVEGLPDPSQCVGERAAAANLVPLPPMEVEEAVSKVRQALDRAYAMSSAGRYAEASESLEALSPTVDALAYDPLQAELRYVTGHVRIQEARYSDARKALEDAAMLGVESHHRSVAADAWTHLVFLETNMFDDYAAAHRAVRLARAEVKALGSPRRKVNRLRAHEGGLAIKEERYGDALATYEELLADPLNEPPLRRADILINMTSVYTELGRYDDAIASSKEYIDVYESNFGRDHPYLALGYYNLGFTYYAMDRFEEALEPMRLSLTIGEATLSPDHPDLSHTHSALGVVLMELERYDEALIHLEHALELLDPSELSVAQRVFHQLGLAEARVHAGQHAAAVDLMDEIETTLASYETPDPSSGGRLLSARALLAREQSDLATAQKHLEAAIEVLGKTSSMRVFLVAQARLELAAVAALREDPDYARELLDDVLAAEGPALEGLHARARELSKTLPD